MTVFYSTNRAVPEVRLDAALLQGQAGDKGLFLPRPIPRLSADLLARARDLSYPELAAEMLAPFGEGVFTREDLRVICREAYDFDIPLERVEGRRYVLRLDRAI